MQRTTNKPKQVRTAHPLAAPSAHTRMARHQRLHHTQVEQRHLAQLRQKRTVRVEVGRLADDDPTRNPGVLAAVRAPTAPYRFTWVGQSTLEATVDVPVTAPGCAVFEAQSARPTARRTSGPEPEVSPAELGQ